ncbi:MAG: hypothetical protein ACLQVY_14635 [Limisphaerales bacterium]
MKEGDIVLTLLPQADGKGKYRPAVVLRRMPGFGSCAADAFGGTPKAAGETPALPNPTAWISP